MNKMLQSSTKIERFGDYLVIFDHDYGDRPQAERAKVNKAHREALKTAGCLWIKPEERYCVQTDRTELRTLGR